MFWGPRPGGKCPVMAPQLLSYLVSGCSCPGLCQTERAEEELGRANHLLPAAGPSREENISIVAQPVSSALTRPGATGEPTWRPALHSFLLVDNYTRPLSALLTSDGFIIVSNCLKKTNTLLLIYFILFGNDFYILPGQQPYPLLCYCMVLTTFDIFVSITYNGLYRS